MEALMNFLPMILIGFVLYFVMIKPQQKRAQEAQNMLNALKRGDHIVTIGGLHGLIEELTDTTVVLDCEGVYLTFERRAISRVVSAEQAFETIEETEDNA